MVDAFAGPAQVSVQNQEHAETVTDEDHTDGIRPKPAGGSSPAGVRVKGPARYPGVAAC